MSRTTTQERNQLLLAIDAAVACHLHCPGRFARFTSRAPLKPTIHVDINDGKITVIVERNTDA